MPILLIILIAILIAQVGFWDAFGSIIGAVAMLVLFFIILIAAIAVAALLVLRRLTR